MGKNKRKRCVQNKSEILATKRISVLQNLWAVNKSNGLLVGTNTVLRHLEKKQLSAVLICSEKACLPIFRTVSFWCKETDVPLLALKADETKFLSSEIPASITYGIKKDCIHLHPHLEESLKQIKVSKTHKTSNCESSENSDVLKNIPSKTVPIEKESFLCHKKHAPKIKKSRTKIVQEDFLALCSSSDSDEEFITSKYRSNDSEFPEYKFVKWKGTELIVK